MPPLHGLLDISSDWYWEQDEHYRFTRIIGGAFAKTGLAVQDYLGSARWEGGATPLGDGGSWDKHKALLAARQPFTDFVFKRPNRRGQLCYINSSGQPVFDAGRGFRGYRGVSRDVTARVQTELRLRIEHGVTHILAEADSIAAAAPRIVQLVCETLGWACGTRWEVDERNNMLRCVETWGNRSAPIAEFLAATARLPPQAAEGRGLVRATWAKGEAMWIPDVTGDRTFRRAPDALRAGLHSAFAFPIKAGAQVTGVMEFFSHEIHQPDAELLNASRYIGSQIGQFVQRKQAEEALRASEERFHNAFEHAPVGILHVDMQGRILRTNRHMAELLGYAQNELAGRSIRDFAAPEDAEVTREIVALRERLYAGEIQSISKERRFVRKDGSQLLAEMTITVLRDASGKPLYDNTTVADVGERKRAEQLLRLEHSVARRLGEADNVRAVLKAAIRAVCEAEGWDCGRYFRVDEKAGLLRFADAWSVSGELMERFIERSRGLAYERGVGLIGEVWRSGQPIWSEDIAGDTRIRAGIAREIGMRGSFVFPVVSDGKTIGVLIFHSREVRRPEAQLLQTIGVIGNQIGQYVQRKEAEEVVRENEARFRSLTQLSSDWFWEQDEALRFTHFSGGALGQTGIDAADLLGKMLWDIPGLAIDPGVQAVVQARMAAREAFYDLEYKQAQPDGSLHYITVSGTPVFDAAGCFTGYRGVAKDITQRKRDEQMLALEHAVNRSLTEAESTAQAIRDAIRAVCETEGWECGRYFALDRNAAVLRFTEAWGLPDPLIERYIAASAAITYARGVGMTGKVWQTGEPLWVSERGQHAGVAQKVFGKTRDVFMFPLIADGKTVGVFNFISRKLRPPDARLLQAVRVIGGQIGQFIQRKQAEEVVRENEARFRSLTNLSSDWFWEQDAEFRFTRFEGRHLSGDNAGFNAELGKTREDIGVEVEGGWDAHRALLAAHRPFRDAVMWRRMQDGKVYYMSISGEPIFDKENRFTGYRGVGKDITRRKRGEQLLALEHAVNRCLADADKVPTALQAVIRTICEAQGWAAGRYFRLDEDAGMLRYEESWSAPGANLDEFIARSREVTYVPGQGLAGKVWQSGKPMWVDDATRYTQMTSHGISGGTGLRAAFLFPVMAEGKVIGVLSFISHEVREPNERMLQAVRVIGSQVGQFMQRMQAEEVMRASEARFRGLTNLSSDLYWEQDHTYRFTAFTGFGSGPFRARSVSYIGTRPWDQQYLNMTEVDWAAHKAVLDSRQSFRDVELCRLDESGSKHWISVSGEPIFDKDNRFIGYRGVGRDITERKRGEQLLALEHAVTRGLTEADSASAAITAAIRAVCETEGWSCGRYLAVDEKAGVLRFSDSWGAPDPDVERYIESSRAMSYAPGEGVVGRVWQSGEPLWVTDIRQDTRVARPVLADETGMRGAFALPVRSAGKTIGVLIFHSRELREPDERLLQAMQVIGSQIGQFVRRRQAEEVLRESEERFRAIVDSANEGILVYDRALRVVGGNATAARIIGLPLADIVGAAGFTSLFPSIREDGSPLAPEDRPTRITVRTGKPQTGHVVGLKRPDGSVTWLSVNTGFLRQAGDSDHYGVVSTFSDITERKRAERATLRLGRMYAALSATNDAILHAESPEELYRLVCDAAVHGGKFSNTAILLAEPRTGGLKVVASAGRASAELHATHISTDETVPAGRGLVGTAFRMQQACISNDFLNDERTRPWHETARKTECVSAAALPLVQEGRSAGVVLFHYDERDAFDEEIVKLLERLAQNVSFALDNFAHEAERRQAQERIQYLATHDGLTDLPNRVMFNQMLNLAIQSARRYQRRFAVLFLDLDRFKIINDTLGHEAGDQLLQEMAKRLKEALRTSDVVARLGGDEFVVLLQEVTEPEQVATVARKLLSTVIKPVVILEQECRVTASIGISMYPTDAQDEQALMKNADAAMYLAKEEGKNNFQFYSKEIKAQSLERLTLETSLRRALEREEFFLHYQAKLHLGSNAITGVEALLRWHHPELGLVSPAQFIPLAEETGLIVPLGTWVLRTACAQNMAWQHAGLPPVCVAVNLSPRQFADENLLHDLARVLAETGMPAELLELEITESMVMGNVDRAARQLAAIKRMGVRLAIDDFGTGYSSLAQIKRFPIDTIKVDRSFIREIPQDSEDKAITQAIIAMGRSLSLTVVAEGVETEAQQAFLREHACDEMQGYYFSKPAPAEEFAELLRTHVARSLPRQQRA